MYCQRFPVVIDRIAEWERAVRLASKHKAATFFASENMPAGTTPEQHYDNANISQIVKVGCNRKGWKQRDFLRENGRPGVLINLRTMRVTIVRYSSGEDD